LVVFVVYSLVMVFGLLFAMVRQKEIIEGLVVQSKKCQWQFVHVYTQGINYSTRSRQL